MNLFNKWNLLGVALLGIAATATARENTGLPLRQDIANRIDAGDCAPASSQIDLNVNNVRARIMNGGDMWWDLVGTAKYEVPKGIAGEPTANSMFASAVWIGGIDQNNQLKVAAQTYRQTGNDFFPGPLDGVGGTTEQGICNDFDRHWQVLGTEIDQVVAAWEEINSGGTANPIPVDQIPTNVLQWPSKGNPYNSVVGQRNLADFYDRDNDGLYDPTMGDYPIIGRSQQCPNTNVYADQMIWWVYNDNGNIHSESGGEPIGMEVQALAFAFRTADEVDNMTFYKYKLLNKSANSINQCFMGVWADPDMGCYTDDYIGCDTERGLGIVYNADPVDENCGSGGSYGNQPPLVGIDYFQGPLDENGVELGMSYFLYYNNDFTITGNPENTSDFYGYLSGKWKDGTPFTEGGTAYGGSTPTNFVFPDEPNTTTGWSECSQQNTAADRRIVQSSGPFTLLPGASNDIVVGVVWVRPPVGTYAPCPTYDLLQRADDKAQALFDNCFKILEGPQSPDARIVEMDRKLILAIEGYQNTESYSQADPVLRSQGIADSLYVFEGYQVYQLKNASVSLQELGDPTNAQLIFQVDIKNGITKLINYTYDANLGVEVPELRVDGADAGIRHTFEITSNAFATGDKGLINHQTYYFAVLPYAYNNFEQNGEFQKTPYLSARSVRVLTGIPHVTEPEFGGLVLNSDYGDGPHITRQEGKGNGGLNVLLTQESVNSILANTFEPTPTYERARGPVKVTVYDPKSVKSGNFELFLRDSTLASHWKTYRVKDTTICTYEQVGGNDSLVNCIDTIVGGTIVTIGGTLDTLPGGQIVVIGGYDTLINGIDTTLCDTITVGQTDSLIGCVTTTIFTDLDDDDPTARDTSLFIVKTPTTANPLTVLSDTAYWVLKFTDSDSIVSEKTLAEGNEQLLPDWGLSIYIEQVENPQLYSDEPYVIDWSIDFEKPDLTWLGGVADVDAHPVLNWIWSGTYATETPDENTNSDLNDGQDPAQFEDPTQQYEVLFGGTVAPYRFASTNQYYGPGMSNPAQGQNSIADLPSIDLVMTDDTSKWTRCVVIEAGANSSNNEGGVQRGRKRGGRSVDKTGNPVSDVNDTGFGWFPGYAVNPETGVRLNMMFAEDSWLIGQNGRDMIWNPTADYTTPNGEWVLGGRHYIYVMKTAYDGGHVVDSLLQLNNIVTILNVYKNVGWVAWPLLNEGFSFKPVSEGLIPTETTIRIRIKHSYEKFLANPDQKNKTLPRYTFGTDDLAAIKGDQATAEAALDTIKVVPNPYYAYSNYESSALDNRVKIANLPQKCTISMYSLDGTLIRRYNRDDNTSTSLDWDLKNTAGIPIASGIYIIHVDAGELGEKTLKWFGVMRPIDLDTF